MNYNEIDQEITAWVQKYSLTFYTRYQNREVRSATFVSASGRQSQIWIDQPMDGLVGIHAWDYENRRRDWNVPAKHLYTALEEATQTVESWL